MFNAPTLRGLAEGRVHCTYRRWTVVRPKVGSRFTTREGVVEITSIDRVALAEYMTFHSVVPAPRTILAGVRKLPPATVRVSRFPLSSYVYEIVPDSGLQACVRRPSES